ncbi:MAG: D-alanine--D-alanine ligase [Planctomyces sp.]|nr:D-alanine--D-alanine ligase [Planctomyces sp.]
MLIGFTYDLRDDYLAEGYGELETAEFDRVDTIDAIVDALVACGHEVDRIGRAKQLVHRLADGCSWDLVFNISEGLRGLSRESQVPSILDVYEIPYTFSDPLTLSVCLHKELAKQVVARAGILTPASLLVSQLSDLDRLQLQFPLFAKPVAEGTGKGVTPASCVNSFNELHSVCRQLLTEFEQPVLVESFLPGREFTVGILGTGEAARVVGTLEIVLREAAEAGVYSYVNKERCEDLVDYVPVNGHDDAEVRQAEELALAAWRALGCRDGGRIDVRSDSHGRPNFIEANPLAGLHPHHSDLPMIATAVGMTYVDLIDQIVTSAAERTVLA